MHGEGNTSNTVRTVDGVSNTKYKCCARTLPAPEPPATPITITSSGTFASSLLVIIDLVDRCCWIDSTATSAPKQTSNIKGMERRRIDFKDIQINARDWEPMSMEYVP